MDKLDQLLDKANDRLKRYKTGILIYKRGNKLSLRGTLPPKPGSDKNKPYQQYLSLGVYCNAAGIKQAEDKAKLLSSQLALEKFDWQDWLNSDLEYALETVGYWADKFEEDYFSRRQRTQRSETTWKVEYQSMFKRLPSQEKLSDRVLLDLIQSTEPDTRTRKRAVMVANALAKFAGLNIDFNRYKGNYSHRTKEVERQLPTDKEIVNYYYSIPNSQWQFVFGLMACYGISNHEVFLVDVSSLQKSSRLVSTYRKAHFGVRRIWCLYPEWYEQWDLGNPDKKLPQVSGNNNRDLGSRVTKAFKRYNLCLPGDLRHCWAIRAMGFMPNPLAARLMAHSEKEHNQTYQRWISEEQEDRFYQLLMERSDRPLPPN